MKKRRIALIMAAVMLMAAGCSSKDLASKKIETENITISQYDGVEIEKVDKPAEITEKDIDGQMDAIIQQNASFEDVKDRSVEMGDFVTIDFTGKMDGKEFDGGSATDYQVEVGAGMMIEGFEESLVGHDVKDSYTWKGKFPEDYGNEEFNGKDVAFDITVKAIQTQNLPEINDKFVQSISDTSKTVEEYRDEVKKDMQEMADEQYESTVINVAWNTVLENAEVKKYPEGRIDEFTEKLIQNYKDQAKVYELEYEEFLEQYMNSTVEEFEKQAAESAEFLAKQELVVDAIAEAEEIKVSDKEFDEHCQSIVDQYGYQSKEELIEDAGEEDLRFTAKMDKVQRWLGEHCVQVEPKEEEPETIETEPVEDSENTDTKEPDTTVTNEKDTEDESKDEDTKESNNKQEKEDKSEETKDTDTKESKDKQDTKESKDASDTK